MEIFMKNIPKSLSDVDLIRGLAEVLHTEPFHDGTSPLINFQVFLHRDKRGNFSHSGRGALTFPTEDIAEQFLDVYGSSQRPHLSCDIGTRLITFTPSRNEAKEDVLALIRSTPYIDPQRAQEQAERAERFQETIPACGLQFGWTCLDNVFSIEWDGPTSNEQYTLSFVDETRQLQIDIPTDTTESDESDESEESDESGFRWKTRDQPEESLLVVLRFSRVESIACEGRYTSIPAVLMTLKYPPSFEKVTTHSDDFGYGPITMRYPIQFLGPSHESVAPFTSLALRIQFYDYQDLATFEEMAELAQLPPVYEITSPSVHRSLFSEENLDRVLNWIEGFEWTIAFQLQGILNDLMVDPVELWDLHEQIGLMKATYSVEKLAEILRLFKVRLKTWSWDGGIDEGTTTLADCLSQTAADVTATHILLRNQSKNAGFFNCHHVTLTPTRMILEGPYPDQSNRIIRQYPNHQSCFLRVNFTDEEQLHYRWDRGVDGATFVRERVGNTLKRGIRVAGRAFQFLAYSSSALKEHAVWFCSPFYDDDGEYVDANIIRSSIGDLSHLEFYPAKYGARMSQAFTATEPSLTLTIDEITTMPDIERNGSCFTDGIGDISRELANKISKSLQKRPGSRKRFYIKPSAFQFRMGGFKGVLAVNYKLKGMDIRLRQSQSKFRSLSRDIEIAQVFYRPKPVFLNRYLIMILETLGVSADVFIKLQDEAVLDVENATKSFLECAEFLETHGIGTSFRLPSVFINLQKLGVGLEAEDCNFPLDDVFLDRSIQFATNHVLRSYTLVGVADVHGYLGPNEVFACIRKQDEPPFCVKGKPSNTHVTLNPGDVRFVHAIGLPPENSPFVHERFYNCLVFSTQGDRSVPSMLAGGDLDGDEYNIILNPELFPSECHPPAEYPPATVKVLNRPCTIDDIADWVAEFINSNILAGCDSLGLVADQFLVLADQSGEMCRDPGCIELAQLASAAVDFSKSGTPVDWQTAPKPRYAPIFKPDWSVGEVDNRSSRFKIYQSDRAIGKLYRRIDLTDADRLAARQARMEHFPRQNWRAESGLSRAIESMTTSGPTQLVLEHPITLALCQPLRRYIDVGAALPTPMTTAATDGFDAYASELRYICATCTLTTTPLAEEEVLMGTIASKTSQPRKRQSQMAYLRTQSDELVKRIRMVLRSGDNQIDPESPEQDEDLEESLLRSWAAWQVAVMQQDRFGAKSFGMIALAAIFETMKEIDERDAE
ncbi:hypothetical protein FRB99_006917 [Tulasnella sp. 403]|nr:hypothetical protein FRB99_006917 [Tulasnella sp. 403]